MIFYGNHEQQLDAKRRLPVTAALRDFIKPDRDGSNYTALVWPDGHLRLYSQAYYVDLVRESLVKCASSAEQQEVLRVFQDAYTLKPDTQGRVVLPEKLIAKAKLPTEVVLRGMTDHIEVWSLAEWKAAEEPVDLASVNEITFRAAQKLAKKGRRANAKRQEQL